MTWSWSSGRLRPLFGGLRLSICGLGLGLDICGLGTGLGPGARGLGLGPDS